MCAQRGAPRGELLIAGSNQRRAKPRQVRIALDQISEERLDGGALGEFARLFRQAHNILQTAEEEDLDANGLRGYRHKLIVSRPLA